MRRADGLGLDAAPMGSGVAWSRPVNGSPPNVACGFLILLATGHRDIELSRACRLAS